MKWYKILLTALFPDTCASCGEIVKDGEYLCDYCFEMLEECNADKICLKCGLPKRSCDCKRKVFYFNGCIAPFYNNGVAKEVMYAFKFRKREYLYSFFAERMSLFIKQGFSDVDFDIITYVPLHSLRKFQRGYNQSYLLARKISEILNIPLADNILGAKFRFKTQHSTSLKLRFDNVKNKYFCKYKLNGKTVLLVDDIKTTGATLNECAKQLMICGANKVYCVTGLITDKKKG